MWLEKDENDLLEFLSIPVFEYDDYEYDYYTEIQGRIVDIPDEDKNVYDNE